MFKKKQVMVRICIGLLAISPIGYVSIHNVSIAQAKTESQKNYYESGFDSKEESPYGPKIITYFGKEDIQYLYHIDYSLKLELDMLDYRTWYEDLERVYYDFYGFTPANVSYLVWEQDYIDQIEINRNHQISFTLKKNPTRWYHVKEGYDPMFLATLAKPNDFVMIYYEPINFEVYYFKDLDICLWDYNTPNHVREFKYLAEFPTDEFRKRVEASSATKEIWSTILEYDDWKNGCNNS